MKRLDRLKAHLKGHATIIIALTASAFDEERAVVLSLGVMILSASPCGKKLSGKNDAVFRVRYIYEDTQQAAIPSQLEEKRTLCADSPKA
ncbi:MAG: hypothetical protein CLLPBCKN_000829 [Chroococcidiopsis cubana SAG 39.79]|uniref:hypothetical protein n=1 Tax=Chroococcidiopsis cubana TaxID=171392 RepID=UPI002AC37E4A|nr:hypothetical protein [Chroococcidiopsis cubana]MDZ4871441.1 hypothetical protein [Chroococcidiopsis cubana SAG 39.79]